MNIYITYEKTFFTEEQIEELSKYAKLIFKENKYKKVEIDDINPVEIYNHNLCIKRAENNEIGYAFEIYDDKTLNDYKGNIMATALYSCYTKETIDKLVRLWCNNTIGILTNNIENVIC